MAFFEDSEGNTVGSICVVTGRGSHAPRRDHCAACDNNGLNGHTRRPGDHRSRGLASGERSGTLGGCIRANGVFGLPQYRSTHPRGSQGPPDKTRQDPVAALPHRRRRLPDQGDGRAIEEIGKYHPQERALADRGRFRACAVLAVRRRPAERGVVALLKRTGDWQKFSGDTSPSGVDPQREKPDKTAAFNAALAEIGGGLGPATTTKKAASKKSEATTDPEVEGTRPRRSRRPTRASLRLSRSRADRARRCAGASRPRDRQLSRRVTVRDKELRNGRMLEVG